MEITVKIPKGFLTRQRIQINEDEFKKDLISFIDQLENNSHLNVELYNTLLSYGIDRSVFEEMIKHIEVFASYDENHENIDFPYENWISRLLEVVKPIDQTSQGYGNVSIT